MGTQARLNLVKMPFVSSAYFSCIGRRDTILLGKSFKSHSRFVIKRNLKDLFFRYFDAFSSRPSASVSSVSCIFKNSSPFAIFRTIVSIWVYSVYCQMLFIARFLRPKHEWNKFNPVIANGYSSCSIADIIKTILVKTSVFHAMPNSIKPSFNHAVDLRSSHFILHKCFHFTLKGA
jgi:flagellar biosynthesis protein FlhB